MVNTKDGVNNMLYLLVIGDVKHYHITKVLIWIQQLLINLKSILLVYPTLAEWYINEKKIGFPLGDLESDLK